MILSNDIFSLRKLKGKYEKKQDILNQKTIQIYISNLYIFYVFMSPSDSMTMQI